MNPSIKSLNANLAELENIKGVTEHEIATELEKLQNADDKAEPCLEWKYETLAFSFCENSNDRQDGWGTYFGPLIVGVTKDGQKVEYPSILQVDELTINYWKRRAKNARNPLLRARYTGLIWDMNKQITGISPDIKFATDCVSNLMKIIKKHLYKFEIDVVHKLERSLSISLSINKPNLVLRIKKVILEFESNITDDSKAGLWGTSFDLLIEKRKIDLTENEENAIIQGLEERLQKLRSFDPWKCEKAAERLARYYRSKGLNEEVARVIGDLGAAFESAAIKAEPLVAISYLEHIYQIYLQYNLKSAVERVSKDIRGLGPKVRDSMRLISHEMKIPQQKFDQFVDQFVKGEMGQSLKLIAVHFIPEKGKIQVQLTELAKSAPFVVNKASS